MKSSRSTWPRRALSGPENCIRRKTSGPADISIKVDSRHDTEGAAGPQQGGDLPGCHGRVWNPRLRQGDHGADLREPRHFQGHDVSLLLQQGRTVPALRGADLHGSEGPCGTGHRRAGGTDVPGYHQELLHNPGVLFSTAPKRENDIRGSTDQSAQESGVEIQAAARYYAGSD